VLDEFFRLLGYGLCHQLPERSFFSGGYQLPVCARDTGIYLGFAVGLLVLRYLAGRTRPSDLPRWPVLVLIGAFVAAMGIDGLTSYSGLRETTNDLRLLTGLLTGWGLSALTMPMINAQVWVEPGEGRVLEGAKQIGLWLIALALLFGVARWVLPLTGVFYPLTLAVAILVTFGAVNFVFVGLIPRFERRARRFRDLWLVLLIAQVFTIAELAGAAWLRSFAESLLL